MSRVGSALPGDEGSRGLTNQHAFLTTPGENKIEVLEALPIVRAVPWREAPEKVRPFNENRVEHRGAIMLSTRGLIAEEPCSFCATGAGKFSCCIALNQLFQGSCSNCQFRYWGTLCSLRKHDATEDHRTQPIPSKDLLPKRKKPEPAGQQSPTSPVHNRKGVITFEDFEPPEKRRIKRAAATSAEAAIAHNLAQFEATQKMNQRHGKTPHKRRDIANVSSVESSGARVETTTKSRFEIESKKMEGFAEAYSHQASEVKTEGKRELVDLRINKSSDNEDNEDKASILNPITSNKLFSISNYYASDIENKSEPISSELPAKSTEPAPPKHASQLRPEEPKSKLRLMIEENIRELKRKLELEREQDDHLKRPKKL